MTFSYLTKSDRRMILLLIVVVAAAFVVFFIADSEQPPAELQPVATATRPAKRHKPTTRYYHQGSPRQPRLAPFDPNRADSTELLQLGLPPFIVRNIYKYRAAGGLFRQKSDMARLYGMTKQQYRQLEPYIRISEEDIRAGNHFYNYEPIEQRDTLLYPIKLQPHDRIVLNSADTLQLRKVPGIGSYFARKIVKYRERLGGYYRVQQLLEIENFPETAIHFFIIPEDSTLRKININRLSLSELQRHPYINFYQARDIVTYRRLHGRIESLQQLSLLRDFTPEAIERLLPYIDY